MTDIEHAKQLLTGEGYTCVICRGDDIHTSEKRGVAPLIELLDSNIDVRGYSAADQKSGDGDQIPQRRYNHILPPAFCPAVHSSLSHQRERIVGRKFISALFN